MMNILNAYHIITYIITYIKVFHLLNVIDASNNKENDNGTHSKKLESKIDFISPEPISKDTFLSSQYDRESQQLYTCYHPLTNHITVR
jgi:hypothetical protein